MEQLAELRRIGLAPQLLGVARFPGRHQDEPEDNLTLENHFLGELGDLPILDAEVHETLRYPSGGTVVRQLVPGPSAAMRNGATAVLLEGEVLGRELTQLALQIMTKVARAASLPSWSKS